MSTYKQNIFGHYAETTKTKQLSVPQAIMLISAYLVVAGVIVAALLHS